MLVQQSPGKLHVRITVQKAKTKRVREKAETIPVDPIAGAVANVGYTLGFTKGLPGYSSLRCEVSLTMPCPAKEVGPMMKKVRTFVKNRLTKEVRSTMEELAESLED